MSPEQRTCVIYCRISFDKTGREAGVDRQEKESRELAERLGLAVDRVYVDNDLSAYSGVRRPQFEAFLKSGVEVAVVWHVDRLVVRNKDLERVIELGIPIHAVMAGHLDLATPAGRAVARTIVAWAHYERELKGERQKSMHRQRREQGRVWWHARTPYGFEADGSPADPAAVRVLYQRVVEGEALAALGRDAGMTAHGIRMLLQNERNRPLVGDDLWDQVGALLRARRTGYRYGVGMLTGVAVCGVCGNKCGTGTHSSHPGSFYVCKPHGHVKWPRELVDAYVGAQIADMWAGAKDQIEERPMDSAAEIAGLSIDFLNGRMSAEEHTAAMERIKQRAARPAAPWVPWALLSEPERREVCQSILEAVVLPARGRGTKVPPRMRDEMLHWRTPVEPPQAAQG